MSSPTTPPASFRPTGRQFWAPGGTLQEMSAGDRLVMAISIDRDLREHTAWIRIQKGRSFQEKPDVVGIAPLLVASRDRGQFIYDTGPCWPIADVVRVCNENGQAMSSRAILQLAWKLVNLLDHAAEKGERVALPCHGNLTPWRICLKPDGSPLLIGYGLPQVEVMPGFEGKVDIESFWFAPPERLHGEPEDVSTDWFSLALVLVYLLQGKPLYDGDVEAVKAQAKRAVARDRLFKHRDSWVRGLTEVLDRMVQRYPDGRFKTVDDLDNLFQELCDSPEQAGLGLEELMAWVAKKDKSGPKIANAPPAPSRAAPTPEQPAASTERWAAPARRALPDRPVRRSEAPAAGREAPERRVRLARDRNALYPRNAMSEEQSAKFHVNIAGDATPQWITLDRSETLAASASRLVDVLEWSPVDLEGRLRGWLRIHQGDASWYGDALTSLLNPDEPIEAKFVDNGRLSVQFKFDQDDITSFTCDVGTAVHAQFLTGELIRTLELDNAEWDLFADPERPMDQWQILDDFGLADNAIIYVRRRRRRIR